MNPWLYNAASPPHPHTNVLPTCYLRRFMFGFRLKAKPEHEAAQVRRWYGAYLAMPLG